MNCKIKQLSIKIASKQLKSLFQNRIEMASFFFIQIYLQIKSKYEPYKNRTSNFTSIH